MHSGHRLDLGEGFAWEDHSILHTELASIIGGYGNIQDFEQQVEEWFLIFRGIFVHKKLFYNMYLTHIVINFLSLTRL